MTAIVKKFDGKNYSIAVTRVSKATAEAEAKKLRKSGASARLFQEGPGKWDVYSRIAK